ncbi:MAG: aminomethyltransferase family protein, partial [Roseibium sp.]|uniref:DUF1989 domain-containing protein n=1 Tax=Roseibium sp. TaxID=1936156 RepID=UPI002629459B
AGNIGFNSFHGIPDSVFGEAILGWIEANGGSKDTLVFREVFAKLGDAESRFTFKVPEDCDLWIAVPRPTNTMDVGGGGSVLAEVVGRRLSAPHLPDPLGTIREEFHVNSGTAQAYRVRKGDYIQVIDIEGRQCSDFMALRADALDAGTERHIDSTVTRTLVGGSYPAPGLFDKFFDQDMRPLLSVVQDTVGRHDTFALACTARGYEERGFPGHLNCSDNISDAFQPYGIARRTAWPAINFFFNSWILPNDNRLQSDEAWSRPGDFVVMRALTDLVCVSTACPDDIDPINGWNPTDIHVRVYDPEQTIRHAIAHRPFAESQPAMTSESAFHPRTSKLTSSFHVARDVWLPRSYDGSRALDEYWACREAVTVQDMSSLRKYDITGPDAEKLLQTCLTRNVIKLSVNRGVYALMLNETGSVIDDGTLFRLAPDLFRWCCGSEESARQLKQVAEDENLKVWVKAQWSAMPNLAIQGPKSRQLLQRIIFTQPHQPALENVKWFGFTIARLGDREGPAFMLTRTGFTGELGYEIFCDRSAATEIWDAIMEAGQDLGIAPMGSDALDMIRIEAGLMVSGAEFTPEVDALEAGLGFAVDMKKDHFIGREAIERNGASIRRSLVGLTIEGTEVPHHGAPVFAGRHQVGVITSATRSPMLGTAIAMCRLAVEHSDIGTELEIGCLDGQMKRLPACVHELPFFDPKRERARA